MTDTSTVRRQSSGSIDYDFYRAQAHALRRQALRDAAAMRSGSVGALVMAGALGFAIVVPAAGSAAGDRVAADWPHSTFTR